MSQIIKVILTLNRKGNNMVLTIDMTSDIFLYVVIAISLVSFFKTLRR